MRKDFDAWNKEKKKINGYVAAPFYHEREIWWCSLGVNVGFEQDGTGVNYDRPVLIVRGFSPHVFFGVALTGGTREGKYYFPLGEVKGRETSVVLSQVRLIDTKRLLKKMETLDERTFLRICSVLQQLLFGPHEN